MYLAVGTVVSGTLADSARTVLGGAQRTCRFKQG